MPAGGGKEIKRYIEIPDELKKLEYNDIKYLFSDLTEDTARWLVSQG